MTRKYTRRIVDGRPGDHPIYPSLKPEIGEIVRIGDENTKYRLLRIEGIQCELEQVDGKERERVWYPFDDISSYRCSYCGLRIGTPFLEKTLKMVPGTDREACGGCYTRKTKEVDHEGD